MMRKLTIFTAAALASAGIGSGATIAIAGDKEELKIENIGEPQNCIQLSRVRSTKVVDGQTIDFKMRGGKTYRNNLANSCGSLGFEKAFSYRNSTNRLCNVDIIRVLESYGGSLREGAACGLGKFQEIKKIKADKKVE